MPRRAATRTSARPLELGRLIALLRARPAAIDEDITVTDPEGTEVLHVEQLSARARCIATDAHHHP